MKVINFFGGPGARKSTVAALTYAGLKEQGFIVELVREYASYMIYADRTKQLEKDQLSALAKQHHLLDILRDKVDIAVSDSPLLLNALYATNVPPSFHPLVFELFDRFDNLNYVLEVDWDTYTPRNRLHSKSAAMRKHEELVELLDRNRVPFQFLPLGEQRIPTVLHAAEAEMAEALAW